MIERLGFDSTWFGLEIGRLACPSPDAERDLKVRADRFDLIYLMGHSLDLLPLGQIGGRITLVDERLDLERCPIAPLSQPLDPRVSRLTSNSGFDEAADIAEESFTASRFYREQQLRSRAGAMYRKWVCNHMGISTPEAGVLGFRAGVSGRIGGFLVFRPEDAVLRIDLVGVASGLRNRGIGRALVEGLQAIAPSKMLRVRVSADNPRALDFYLLMGFYPRVSDVIVHRWTRRQSPVAIVGASAG